MHTHMESTKSNSQLYPCPTLIRWDIIGITFPCTIYTTYVILSQPQPLLVIARNYVCGKLENLDEDGRTVKVKQTEWDILRLSQWYGSLLFQHGFYFSLILLPLQNSSNIIHCYIARKLQHPWYTN